MKVASLKVANVRAIEAAEFRFQPEFNLIVGVNGVGKTTVLDALGVCLSAYVRRANKLYGQTKSFTADDIRVDADALSVECDALIGPTTYRYLIHKPRETSVPQKKVGMPREQVHDTPEKVSFLGDLPKVATGSEPDGRPLAVMYSTNRAVPSDRAPSKNVAAGGTAAAFADAFASRELRLREFSQWMRVQEVLWSENASPDRTLAAFGVAVSRFLPKYRNLRVNDDGRRLRLLIDRGSSTVAVQHMSDGERGTLALILDLTRRLAQANPEMSDPVAQAEAVVLIDEIDLHLHPTWQRQIVHKLTTTFPRCQFIATTHSPQVIGEIEHDRIHIMADGVVFSPTHSFGVDSSRVLEEIMEADPRTEGIQKLLTAVSNGIGKQRYDDARESLAQLVDILGEGDPEVTRISTLLAFLEGEE